MGRAVRNDIEGGWHHVMNRGAGRQRTFFIQQDGTEFERLLGEGCVRFGVEIHSYCLMPNHFHLLVHCPDGGLGRFMQHVTGVYTRHINDRRGSDGALFRGRYRSVDVVHDRHLLNGTLYIHRNPKDLRPTTSLDQYRWSSHGAYVGRRPSPPWLVTTRLLDMFDGGRCAFHDAVVGRGGRLLTDCPPKQLLALVDLLIDECDVDLGRARQGIARTVVTALIGLVDDATRRRLLEALNFSDDVARTLARQRADRRVAESSELQAVLRQILHRAA